MERTVRVEPTFTAWKAVASPRRSPRLIAPPATHYVRGGKSGANVESTHCLPYRAHEVKRFSIQTVVMPRKAGHFTA